jgi:biopolymer transport protein ExbD
MAASAAWDVFHSDRLEIERGLSTAEVRAALARGELHEDDLIRPAGTSTPWARLADNPPLGEPEPGTIAEAVSWPAPQPGEVESEIEDAIIADDEDDEEPFPASIGPYDEGEYDVVTPRGKAAGEPYSEYDLNLRERESRGASNTEVVTWDDGLDEEEYDPQEEDEAAAEFTLAKGSTGRVEENLDLAAMVDVAFQLVLFFLVTATTVLYKSLEVPKPNPETNPTAAAQGRAKTMDDLKSDFILVEIDPAGAVKIDREPVAAEMPALVERLRAQREQTQRNAMLLSADFSTPHRSAVLAYDAANEIGLGIAIARPAPPPTPPVAPPRPSPAPSSS